MKKTLCTLPIKVFTWKDKSTFVSWWRQKCVYIWMRNSPAFNAEEKNSALETENSLNKDFYTTSKVIQWLLFLSWPTQGWRRAVRYDGIILKTNLELTPKVKTVYTGHWTALSFSSVRKACSFQKVVNGRGQWKRYILDENARELPESGRCAEMHDGSTNTFEKTEPKCDSSQNKTKTFLKWSWVLH